MCFLETCHYNGAYFYGILCFDLSWMPFFSFVQVATACASSWTGHATMTGIFRNMFGSQSCPHIVKYNDFSNFIAYFIQKVGFKYRIEALHYENSMYLQLVHICFQQKWIANILLNFVTLVPFVTPVPCVGWVCQWFSPCFKGFFSQFSNFRPCTKTNISRFQFNQDRGPEWKPARADLASSLNTQV